MRHYDAAVGRIITGHHERGIDLGNEHEPLPVMGEAGDRGQHERGIFRLFGIAGVVTKLGEQFVRDGVGGSSIQGWLSHDRSKLVPGDGDENQFALHETQAYWVAGLPGCRFCHVKILLRLIAAACLGLAACGGSSAQPQTIELSVTDPPGEPKTVEVAVGTPVTIEITTATDDRAHLHGYELEMDTKAGEMATMSFTANMAGSYELESHVSNTIWLNLVVK